jgi:hypothetical protein
MRRWLLRAIAERTRALLAPSAPKSARMEEDEGTAVFHAMHGIGAYIRIRFGGGLPTLPDPVPDVPKPRPPRPTRPGQRPVYDPHAFYPDEEGLGFGA